MNEINLKRIKKVHFVGVGGIGISAIAAMFLAKGKKVTGSDRSSSEVTKELKKRRAKILIGHKSSNLDAKTDLVIYTIAVPHNNPELKKARKLGIKTLTYPQALGILSKEKYTIAVSGSHGKTTTTAMCAGVLKAMKKAPTVIVGSFLGKSKRNFVPGKSEYIVVEACEYKKSFLNLYPNILVITNIDNDHLDYYKNLRNVQKAFKDLARRVPKDGFIICDKKNKTVKPILKGLKCEIIDYKKIKTDFTLKVPGEHNVLNAKAASAVGEVLNGKKGTIKKALQEFKGTWRRGEYKGKTKKGALVYDDYAHHPTAVKAALKGFREIYPRKNIIAVFQSHTYSRTRLLLDDFARSFGKADKVIITQIYAAREKIDKRISGQILTESIRKYNKNTLYIKSFEVIEKKLKKETGKGDIVITIGAGDAYKIGEGLLK